MIEAMFSLLFFFVPLVLSPWNYELFEFNKMLLVYAATVVITGFWLIEMVIAKKVIYRGSFWDIPLLIFLGGQILATIFSIDVHTSIWGYYSRFNGGLLSTISYLLLYWAFVTHMDKEKTLSAIRYLLFSAFLVATYGIAEHFGIDSAYWVQDVRNRVFSSLGQPNWLAAYLVALIPLTWAFALAAQGDKQKLKYSLFFFLSSFFFLCLLYTKSKSGLLGFFVSFAVFWLLAFVFSQNWKTLLKPFSLFAICYLLFTILVGTPWTPAIKNFKYPVSNIQYPTISPPPAGGPTGILVSESGDIRKVVWQGAIDIGKNYPILGTGVETFAYSYYWFRPSEHNDLSEWDFLYNKAHNEYLNFWATTGIVGLGSYLILIGVFLVFSLKKIPNFINLALLAGFASILLTNFFGFAVVPVSLLFFLFPAFAVSLTNQQKTLGVLYFPPLRWSSFQLLITVFLIFNILYLIFNISKYWYADTRFALAEQLFKSNQTAAAFAQITTAIKFKDDEPVYHDQMGLIGADLAVIYNQERQATLSSQLKELALEESEKALKISPYNLNFWKDRTKIAYKLAEIDPEYYQLALTSLLEAAELAPTDAKIQLNLGILYSQISQEDMAITALLEAIELKPNYEAARYTLALFYQKDKEYNKAKEQLRYILERINANYQPAIEKLKEIEKTP